MAYDIYGNKLKPGHCERHPNIAETYPCYQCYDEDREWEYKREMERAYSEQMYELMYEEYLFENQPKDCRP